MKQTRLKITSYCLIVLTAALGMCFFKEDYSAVAIVIVGIIGTTSANYQYQETKRPSNKKE